MAKKSNSKGSETRWKSKSKKFNWNIPLGLAAFIMGVAVVVVLALNVMKDEETSATEEEAPAKVAEVSDFIHPDKPITFVQLSEAFFAMNTSREAITSLSSIVYRGRLLLPNQELELYSVKKAPDKALIKLKLENGDRSFIINGNRVWSRVDIPGRDPIIEELSEEAAALYQNIGRFHSPTLEMMLGRNSDLQSIERTTFEGQEAIEVTFQQTNGPLSKSYLDPKTLNTMTRIDTITPEYTRRVNFSEYEKVDGLSIPGKISYYTNGDLSNELIINSIELNAGVLSELFNVTAKD